MRVEGRDVGVGLNRPADQRNRYAVMTGLVRDQAQQMQGVRVTWVVLQHLTIHLLRLGETSRRMMIPRLGEKACDPLRRRCGHRENAHLLSQRDRHLSESWSLLEND